MHFQFFIVVKLLFHFAIDKVEHLSIQPVCGDGQPVCGDGQPVCGDASQFAEMVRCCVSRLVGVTWFIISVSCVTAAIHFALLMHKPLYPYQYN